MPEIQIVPSLLSANQEKLDSEVREIKNEVSRIQLDVMDGKFVNPIGQSVNDLKKISDQINSEIHLMVKDPLDWVDDFINAGASLIIFHFEIEHDIAKIINQIRKKKVKVGLALNPKTPLEKAIPFLDKVDLILLMAVEPGYSGQKFMYEVIPKIKKLRSLRPNLDIEVDGGINKETIGDAVKAGANVIVAASAIFGQKDRVKAIRELKQLAK